MCAAPQIIEGVALQEPLSIDLDFSNNEYLLVRASQSHANYSLELIENTTKKIVRKVNFPSDYPVDEILLVNADDCNECTIILKAFERIDTNSPYTLSIEAIPSADIKTIELLQKLSTAGEYRQKADEVEQAERTMMLEKTNIELNAIIETNLPPWRFHALSLLIGTNSLLNKSELIKENLAKLIEETSPEASSLRAYALLEYTSFENDKLKEGQIYENVLQLAQEFNDDRAIALAKNYKAVYLVNNASYDEALSLLSESKIELNESQRFRDLILPLHNLSWATQRAGMLPESLAHATEQLLTAETYDNKESRLLALYNFAMTYRQIGERFVSEEFLDKAIEQHSQLPSNSSLAGSTGAYLLQEKTQGLVSYGAFESALDFSTKTKQAFAQLGLDDNSAGINVIEGQIAFAMQNFQRAEEKFKQSIEYDLDNNRTLSQGINLLLLAKLKIAQQEYVDASTYQSQALQILAEAKHYPGLGRAFSQAAELLFHLGAHQDAQYLLERTSAFIEKYALEHDKAELAYRQALVENEVGNLSAAKKSLEYARALIEDTLPKIRQRNLRQSYLALQKSIFELNIKVMLASDPNNLLAPLALAETYKARTLSEDINSIQNDDKNPNDELSQQRKLILDKIQANAVTWHANKQQQENHQSLLSDSRELSQSLEKIELKFADSQGEPIGLSQPVSAEQLPKPHNNQLIAYYFVGNSHSWLWVITNQAIDIYNLPAERELTVLANQFLSQISSPPTSRQGSTAWEQASSINALSETLLSPLKKYLENSTIDLITIIADGPLHGLSFAPLKLPENESPIIKDYALSYAPSLMINKSLNQRFRTNNSTNNLNLLVVADPVNQQDSNLNFADLPFSKQEALTIQSLTGDNATLLLSANASKTRLLNELSKPYSILHFATHGLLNRHEPSLSGLALSAESSSDTPLWLSPEISNTKISADLVILSACDSSIGKSVSGEGLFSLSRAFIEGGANQVIGTLWSVQDQSTSALFQDFYSNLLDEKTGVAQALQQAQLAIYLNNNNDWSDPYYWAGFQLLGGGANQSYGL